MLSPSRVVLLTAFTVLSGCGPNYRYVYDGESAFERCYGLDYDTSIADSGRASCWSAWLQSYSYGANPDRVDFARNRLAATGAVQRSVSSPSSGSNATTQGVVPALVAPAAAPAAALTVDVDRVAARAQTPVDPAATSPWTGRISTGGNPVNAPPPTHADNTGAEPPGATCGRECRSVWSTGTGRCPRQDAACVARSDEGYRECMRGCF